MKAAHDSSLNLDVQPLPHKLERTLMGQWGNGNMEYRVSNSNVFNFLTVGVVLCLHRGTSSFSSDRCWTFRQKCHKVCDWLSEGWGGGCWSHRDRGVTVHMWPSVNKWENPVSQLSCFKIFQNKVGEKSILKSLKNSGTKFPKARWLDGILQKQEHAIQILCHPVPLGLLPRGCGWEFPGLGELCCGLLSVFKATWPRKPLELLEVVVQGK